jgi:flagellar basal body-associated protein FliL
MKKSIPIPLVVVIFLVIVAVIAGFYVKSTEIKPIHMWTKEEAQQKMKESQKALAGKGSSPAAPAPPVKTKP